MNRKRFEEIARKATSIRIETPKSDRPEVQVPTVAIILRRPKCCK